MANLGAVLVCSYRFVALPKPNPVATLRACHALGVDVGASGPKRTATPGQLVHRHRWIIRGVGNIAFSRPRRAQSPDHAERSSHRPQRCLFAGFVSQPFDALFTCLLKFTQVPVEERNRVLLEVLLTFLLVGWRKI